jgi:hypothetical protein
VQRDAPVTDNSCVTFDTEKRVQDGPRAAEPTPEQWLVQCADPFGRDRAMTVLAETGRVTVVSPPGESAVLSVRQLRTFSQALDHAAATGWPTPTPPR